MASGVQFVIKRVRMNERVACICHEYTYTLLAWDTNFPFHEVHRAVSSFRRFRVEALETCDQGMGHSVNQRARKHAQMDDLFSIVFALR